MPVFIIRRGTKHEHGFSVVWWFCRRADDTQVAEMCRDMNIKRYRIGYEHGHTPNIRHSKNYTLITQVVTLS